MRIPKCKNTITYKLLNNKRRKSTILLVFEKKYIYNIGNLWMNYNYRWILKIFLKRGVRITWKLLIFLQSYRAIQFVYHVKLSTIKWLDRNTLSLLFIHHVHLICIVKRLKSNSFANQNTNCQHPAKFAFPTFSSFYE